MVLSVGRRTNSKKIWSPILIVFKPEQWDDNFFKCIASVCPPRNHAFTIKAETVFPSEKAVYQNRLGLNIIFQLFMLPLVRVGLYREKRLLKGLFGAYSVQALANSYSSRTNYRQPTRFYRSHYMIPFPCVIHILWEEHIVFFFFKSTIVAGATIYKVTLTLVSHSSWKFYWIREKNRSEYKQGKRFYF